VSKGNKKKNLLLFLAVGFVFLFFYMKTRDNLINYPDEYLYYLMGLVFIIQFLLFYKKWILFKKEFLELGLVFVRYFYISWNVAALILIPFNIYLVHEIDNSDTTTLTADLLSASTLRPNQCIFYSIDGETDVHYGYKPVMDVIESDNNASDYFVEFKVKKGKLGVYRIKKWEIKKK
jgi:hypothetical protein